MKHISFSHSRSNCGCYDCLVGTVADIKKNNQLFRREHSIVRKFGVRIQGFMSCQGGLATSFCFPEFETSTPRFPKRVDHRDGRIQLYALFSIANDMCFLSR